MRCGRGVGMWDETRDKKEKLVFMVYRPEKRYSTNFRIDHGVKQMILCPFVNC